MIKNLILCTIAVFFMISCSDDESPSIAQPSNFIYAENDKNIVFYSSGNSETPTVDWGGDIGTFELGNSITGISIDQNTGVISWQGGVPLGDNQITVIARNSAGSISTSYTIRQSFSGSFDGGYNANPNSTTLTSNDYNLTFASNGTLTVRDGTSTGTGTWNFTSGNNLDFSYTYTASNTTANVDGNLTFSTTSIPVVDGIWTVPSSGRTGYLRVSLN